MESPPIDISLADWVIVQKILRRWIPDYEVWAFGSRATRTARRYSDLDLAVIADQPLGLATGGALADEFVESDLPFKVDVIDWATTGESFRAIVERDRVVVQCASGTTATGAGTRCPESGQRG